MGRLCVFGRWEPVPGPAGGLFGPSGREQERAERGRNRPRGGAGEGKLAEVWSEGWWRAAGRCAEGVASRRRGGGSWRRGVAGEHAARGHCLTGIEPLRGSTTSFSVTSGARSPAAFRPRWPLSAPLIASAPVPAPALVPRPSAPLASLRSFNRFRPRWPLSAPLIASAPVPAPALVPRPSAPLASLRSCPRPGALSPARSRSRSRRVPVPAPGTTRSRSRRVPVPAPGASLSPLPARPVPTPGSCPRCIQAGPCCRICAKKTPGPPKEGSGVEFRSAREAASPSMRWITSLRQEPGA